jgi:predicted lipid-binding transport protein (Tim44 family)
MGEGGYLDLILLAMVAGFVLLRLRSVLGRRTGQEQEHREGYERDSGNDDQNGDDNVIPLPDRGDSKPSALTSQEAALWSDDSPVGAGLTQIKIADHSFEPGEFVNGARMAYEMIVTAFAEGNRKALGNLLSEEVLENFENAIDDREARNETLETSIVDIKSADIVEASLSGSVADVTVKIVAETISAAKDSDGELLDPNAVHSHEVTDIWTFSRDTKNRSPNWLLIETRSQN